MRFLVSLAVLVASFKVQQAKAFVPWPTLGQRLANNMKTHTKVNKWKFDDENQSPPEKPQGPPEQAAGVSTLSELKSMVKGVDDRPTITALARAIKQSKIQLLEAMKGGTLAGRAAATLMCADLAAVSPLPSPAFASNLLVGRLVLRGELGSFMSGLAAAVADNEGELLVEMPLQPGKPSKSGYGLKRGGTLLVRLVTGGPALAELTCEGPSSFTVDGAAGPETWEITYLDQVKCSF
jgi:hypothetical protein